MTNRFFTKISQIIHNNPIKVIIAVVLLTIGLAFGLPNIQMNMGNEVFVDTNSQVYKDTKTYQETSVAVPRMYSFPGIRIRL